MKTYSKSYVKTISLDHQIISRFFSDSQFHVFDINGQIWFKLQDITAYFGMEKSSHISDRLYDEEIAKIHETSSHGGMNTLIISEGGLFHFVLSLKPSNARGITREEKEKRNRQIKEFVLWVSGEVLPSIRQHGGYIAKQETLDEDTRSQLMQKVSELSKEVEEYNSKARKFRGLLYEEEDRAFTMAEEIAKLRTEKEILAAELKKLYGFLFDESSVNEFAARLRGFKEAEALAESIREEESRKAAERKRIDEDIDRYNRNVLCPGCEKFVFRGQCMSKEEAFSLDKK